MKIDSSNYPLILGRHFIERLILSFAKILAVSGGLILILMVIVNIISIIGRVTFGVPLVGDFELIEIACGVSIFMFLPICKLKNGNIIVDAFTLKLNQRKKIFLDIFSDLVFGMVALFFSYRMIFGLLDMMRYNEQTMLLEIPVWIPFGPAIFSLFFLSLICFWSSLNKFQDLFFVREI
ncbi:MAG: TRAP transporter small permease [Paracoccaceae bacterium]|nr:TRAP transporter small permease [Paracoccaceae bacterium]